MDWGRSGLLGREAARQQPPATATSAGSVTGPGQAAVLWRRVSLNLWFIGGFEMGGYCVAPPHPEISPNVVPA